MSQEQEQWKSLADVVTNGENYEASIYGQVRNVKTGRELKPSTTKDGYSHVVLRNKSSKDHYVHRLVAMAFLENPDKKSTVNHKNGKKSDNSLDNLEWAGRLDQVSHALSNELYRKGEGQGNAFIYDGEVFLIHLIEGATQAEIADVFNCSIQHINKILSGQSRKGIKELADQLDSRITLDQAITARAYFRLIKWQKGELTGVLEKIMSGKFQS